MVALRIAVIDDPSAEAIEAVHAVLRRHNATANSLLWEKLDDPQHEPRPLRVFALDDANEALGGLFAETAFLWLKIHIMAVREEQRGLGIGSKLLQIAEEEAVRRGCTYAFLDTMDYQAPDFYLRQGYAEAGRIPDWDSHGHTKIFMTKTL